MQRFGRDFSAPPSLTKGGLNCQLPASGKRTARRRTHAARWEQSAHEFALLQNLFWAEFPVKALANFPAPD